MINEIKRRRTFAIVSHPDAGKTTLTEKFLLYGDQIHVAGAVKNNKIKKTATSDWMEIEKQRGISVSTSVMESDSGNHVEIQTRKLMEVCRMCKTPVMIFINKMGREEAEKLRSELELITAVYPAFDRDEYLNGSLAPVFFGSALNHFGVQEVLDCLVETAPSPRPIASEERIVYTEEPAFTGFIFMITAQIDFKQIRFHFASDY